MNKVLLVGRLTKDPELKKTNTGKSVCNFTVAVNRNRDEADFINCVAWEKTAETLCQYMRKGGRIGVEGSIQTRKIERENGAQYVTEVRADRIEFLNEAEPW